MVAWTRAVNSVSVLLNSVSALLVTEQIQKTFTGRPWWSSGEESTCRCGGHGFRPRISDPPATGHLSPCATATESALEPVLRDKRSNRSKNPERHISGAAPCSLQVEKAHRQHCRACALHRRPRQPEINK